MTTTTFSPPRLPSRLTSRLPARLPLPRRLLAWFAEDRSRVQAAAAGIAVCVAAGALAGITFGYLVGETLLVLAEHVRADLG